MEDAASLVIPFSWEEKPGVPKQPADDHIALSSNYRGYVYGHDYGYNNMDRAAGLQLATSLMPPLPKPPRMEAAALVLRAGGAVDSRPGRASHGRTASSVGENTDRRIVAASAIASRTHKSSSNISHRPKLINIKDDPFLLAIQACINSNTTTTTNTCTTFIRSASSSSLSHDRRQCNSPNYPHHDNNTQHHYHRRCNTDMQAAQSSSPHHHHHERHLTIAQLLSREKMLELEEDNHDNDDHHHHHHELTRHMQREPLLSVGDSRNSLRMIRSYKSQLTLQLRHHRYDNKPSIFARCFGCIL